jgi:hypothetical protein
VFQTYVSSASSAFLMLQVLHMNVSKVDRHMGCAWEAGGDANSPRVAAQDARAGKQRPAGAGSCVGVRPDVRALVVPIC